MFNWSLFLDLADELVARTKTAPLAEASWRAGVSRAYYAAFHVVKAYVVDCEGVTLPTSQVHGFVLKTVDTIAKRDKRNEDRNVHIYLSRLRDAREAADYDTVPAYSQANAKQAATDARVVLSCVGHLRRKRGIP